MEEAQFWIESISNLGFPIVIALYLLNRYEPRLDKLRTSIDELNSALREHKDSTKDGN